jgi:putative endonuclease
MAMSKKKDAWSLYLVRCSDDSIYTGISKNVDARIERHNQGKGARFTAARRPVVLIYQEKHKNRISAMKREIEIKRWPKTKKEKLANPL